MNDPLLDDFAELVVERFDEAIDRIELAACGESKVPKGYESLQAELAKLDPRAVEVVLKCVVMTAESVLAGALFTVWEMADNGDWEISIKGKKLSDITPGLHDELVREGGWLQRFGRRRGGAEG